MADTDKVIFRKWRGKDGDVIALFPEMAASPNWYLCESYMHVGQHGAATPDIVTNTRPASQAEYRELKEELERIGYNLVVVKRFTYQMFQVREAQCKTVPLIVGQT